MAEQRTFNPLVQGSTPWRPTHLTWPHVTRKRPSERRGLRGRPKGDHQDPGALLRGHPDHGGGHLRLEFRQDLTRILLGFQRRTLLSETEALTRDRRPGRRHPRGKRADRVHAGPGSTRRPVRRDDPAGRVPAGVVEHGPVPRQSAGSPARARRSDPVGYAFASGRPSRSPARHDLARHDPAGQLPPVPRQARPFPCVIHSTSTMPPVNQYLHLHVLLHDSFKRALGRAGAKAMGEMVTRTGVVNHCR
jgi:hypothetical protein